MGTEAIQPSISLLNFWPILLIAVLGGTAGIFVKKWLG